MAEPVEGSADPSLIVGLGASAGGLEALREFFVAMPVDTGCAFVVVQHLSPDYKSIMDELLARNTAMPVVAIENGIRLQANTVYLLPPRQDLRLDRGHLYLEDQSLERGVHLPIDVFFRSLAESAERRSVAIVLSGTGSDGSRGIKSIKEVGGLVLVQDPDSAKFDGMPVTAARTGVADFVLPPDELALYLERYVSHPLVSGMEDDERNRLESNEEVLTAIFALLRDRSGIEFSHYKASTVARRIERRMGINHVPDHDAYLTLLRKSDGEVQTLAREMLINVTRFFRDTEAFEFLARQVVREIVDEAHTDTEIRVWVAGCSTGEEAYSIAILLDETLREAGSRKRVKLFATDVDAEAISIASHGRYSTEIAADVSQERLERYFSASPDGYAVRSEIRQRVVFATHNMISDPPFSNMDLISCRNVLIYFQQPVQQKVIAAFHFSLRKRGIAFFGKAESVGELNSHFEPLQERLKLFRKRDSTHLPLTTSLRASSPDNSALRPVAGLLRGYRSAPREQAFDHVKDSLINDHVPACMILDADHHAVHIYGGANRYLTRFPSGRVSTNVHDIIAEDLSVAVSTALTRAEQEGNPVFYEGISVAIGNTDMIIDLETEHFAEKNGKPSYFVIMLSERDLDDPRDKRIRETFDLNAQTRQRIQDLESELLQKQENLQVSNEELETTNEELQSANEELMSSNEELQSANEELQSVNEELFTVNNEYQEKITELSVANGDLDHVLSLTSIGLIFVDEQLRVRKYTSLAARYFSLLRTDIGRPLHHIANELDYPQLFDDFDGVLGDGATMTRDVFTVSGELVEIRLMRNRNSSEDEAGRSGGGAVLTLVDLSSRVRDDRHALIAPRADAGSDAGDGTSRRPRAITVLLVDDNAEDRYALRRQLDGVETVDFDVVEASDVAGALAALDEHAIDVCLVDFRLGGDTAIDFSKQRESRHANVPVIVLSGNTRAELQEELPSLESTHFLNKEEVSPLLLQLTLLNALDSDTP